LDPGDLLEALEKSAAQAEWTPLFADAFDRTSLGDDWRIVNGRARIVNGWLKVVGSSGDVYAAVRRPFPDNVRVEFDARFPATGVPVSDLGCFVAGDEHRCDHVGYCLSFGADNNICSRIQREGVDIRINTEAVAEPGRSYHLAAELVDGNLTLYVDGKQILSYLDMIPLAGVGHDHLGLVTFKHGGEFASVKVLTHSGPTRTGAFTVADAYCRDGLYDRAIERYRQVAAAHPDQPLGLLAQCKVALALIGDSRWSEAEAQLRGLAGPAEGSELEHLVALWHGRTLGMMGKIDEALRGFSRVQAATNDPGIIDETAVACGLLCEHLRTDSRWLEAGRCAKFLFENLQTPLIETSHMFGHYGSRLRDAALFEEEYQAVTKLGVAIASRAGDPGQLVSAKLRRASAAILTGRFDRAREIYDGLEAQAREEGSRSLELTVLASRAELELSLGKYDRAFERVQPFAGTEEEEMNLREMTWGSTLADLRAIAVIFLGRMDEALDDLDAGRISKMTMDLRLVLAAELWRRDRKAAAGACLAELKAAMPRRTAKFAELATAAIRGEVLVEALMEFVEASLQPVQQARGTFYAGLALWAGGNDGAATLPWSEAKNAAPDVTPIWHWASYFQGRVET